VYGSFERFIAILIEHFAGAFPVWLAPVQAVIITVADRHYDYARKVLADLEGNGFRAELDERGMSLNAKIRESQVQKVPYAIGVGVSDHEVGVITIRPYGRKR